MEAHPELVAQIFGERPATASENDCYAEMRDKGQCSITEKRPDNPSPDFPREEPEPPPIELPPGGGSPIEDDPKERLAQLSPVAPPCGTMGPVAGMLCSIPVFGVKPPKLPPKTAEPIDRGHQYFAPQILCNWHILCNRGQEPDEEQNRRDDERIPGSETSGKTLAELEEICVKQNIVHMRTCNAIINARGGSKEEKFRAFDMCKERANNKMYACFRTAKQLTDNGQHPAP